MVSNEFAKLLLLTARPKLRGRDVLLTRSLCSTDIDWTRFTKLAEAKFSLQLAYRNLVEIGDVGWSKATQEEMRERALGMTVASMNIMAVQQTFQKKCLEKMEDVGQRGRTVLFVSHSMPAVTRLCERVILLDDGGVIEDGPAHQVVGTYLKAGTSTTASYEWSDPRNAPGGDVARLRAVRVCTEEGRTAEHVDIREPCRVEMTYDVLKSDHVLPFELLN